MIQAIRKRMNQKGFTLVELMVVIAILGVLAAIAIPKFTESTAAANTAKIQADLRTIDSAIIMAAAAGHPITATADVGDNLKDYLASTPIPPSGKAYMKAKATDAGTSTDITANAKYKITVATGDGEDKTPRATLMDKTSDLFGK